MNTVIKVESAILEEGEKLRRSYPRPKEFRQKNYSSSFDDLTLFYGAIRKKEDDRAVVCIAPPLRNLIQHIEYIHGQLDTGGWESAQLQHSKLKRLDRVTLNFSRRVTKVRIKMGDGQLLELPIEEPIRRFADKVVLVTLFRYDKPVWLADWMTYYVKIHQIDEFLLFFNNPEIEDLKQFIEAIPENLKKIATFVHWPFKYGPSAGGSGLWDSNFCQTGMLDYAFWRFLTDAKLVLNFDIDELLVSDQPILAKLLNFMDREVISVSVPGKWVASDKPSTFTNKPPRHRDGQKYCNVKGKQTCPPKWILQPKALNHVDFQLLVHRVDHDGIGISGSEIGIEFAHFAELNTQWKKPRIIENRLGEFSSLLRLLRRVQWPR